MSYVNTYWFKILHTIHGSYQRFVTRVTRHVASEFIPGFKWGSRCLIIEVSRIILKSFFPNGTLLKVSFSGANLRFPINPKSHYYRTVQWLFIYNLDLIILLHTIHGSYQRFVTRVTRHVASEFIPGFKWGSRCLIFSEVFYTSLCVFLSVLFCPLYYHHEIIRISLETKLLSLIYKRQAVTMDSG
jgi:hypothetical protein